MPYGLRIPVVGELDLRRVVAGRGEEDEREAPALVLDAAQLAQSQQVAVEVQRLLEVGHAHHRVQVLHAFHASTADRLRRSRARGRRRAPPAITQSTSMRVHWSAAKASAAMIDRPQSGVAEPPGKQHGPAEGDGEACNHADDGGGEAGERRGQARGSRRLCSTYGAPTRIRTNGGQERRPRTSAAPRRSP